MLAEATDKFDFTQIVSVLVTLYAIVPSIIITTMYSFLSDIDQELAALWNNISVARNGYLIKCSHKVNKFVIISSKIFHVSMAYYLILLFASLFSKCIGSGNRSLLIAICIATVFYVIYFFVYFYLDIRKSLESAFDHRARAWKIFWMVFIVFVYGLGPIVVIIILSCIKLSDEITVYLSWITLTILDLLIWWLILPFAYQPLTNLSYIKKNLPKICLNNS